MSDPSPFFSVCVPQYDRTSFLIEALRVLSMQPSGTLKSASPTTVCPTGAGKKLSWRCKNLVCVMCTTGNRGIVVTTEICGAPSPWPPDAIAS